MKKILSTNPSKFLLLIFILILSFFLSLFLGAEKINIESVLSDPESLDSILLFELRLPRSILCLISGILLASSAAVFQMFFRNYLAEPGLLGISAGATVGAVIAQISSIPLFAFGCISIINIFSFFSAILSSLILIFICSRNRHPDQSIIVLLCGTALGTLYSALTSLIIIVSSNKNISGVYSWLMGTFNGKGFDDIKFLMLPALISFLGLVFISNPLDLLNGGENSAQSLGVNIKILRFLVLIFSSLAISVCVCAGGIIGFIGLIAPNLMRKFFKPNSRVLILASSISGASLLLVADTLSRTLLAPAEIPCGIITAFIGIPFFFSLIFKKVR